MKKSVLIILCLAVFAAQSLPAKDKDAYRIFLGNGKAVSYSEMLASVSKADVIFIGETHNCPIAHWMEYVITEDLVKKHPGRVIIGAEMLERDNQLLVDEYVTGIISSDRFETEAKVWDNHYTDYAPLLYLAREHSLRFVATNVPRRYASFTKDHGLDTLSSLSEEAKALMAPLPIRFEASESDEAMFGLMMAVSGNNRGAPSYFAQAQALKDATMAWSIAQNYSQMAAGTGKKPVFIHYNGNYHSDFHSGIIPYLDEYLPGLEIATICCVRQESISQMDKENRDRADFIICVPESMTSTF